MSFEHKMELSASGDPPLDYCLWPYPHPSPAAGKYRSYNLLLNSFQTAGIDPACTEANDMLRDGLGAFQTVWGVKWAEGKLGWEYYFYDYQRMERTRSIEKVLAALAPRIDCPLQYSGDHPYFMFSIDFDEDTFLGRKNIEDINVYIGNPGSNVSSGISYILDDRGLTLGNLYYFFKAREEKEDVFNKVACSAHLALREFNLYDVLWPEMLDCQTIVVANKRRNDSVYFSRITIEQLLFFLIRMNYPKPIVDYVSENRDKLNHLLYDVGIDYIMRDGRIVILKSGYYGVF